VVENGPEYWAPDWSFETWQHHPAPDSQFTESLLGWARSFHAEETWILDGALQTLWKWHRDQTSRESLDIGGFRAVCCVDTLSSDEDRQFTFKHLGWDPQFERWARFRNAVTKEFQTYLNHYHQRLSSRMESQGALRARRQFSVDNFEWFALYQLGGMSASRILESRLDQKHDESTIMKGVNTAAGLLQWKNPRRVRKVRAQRSSLSGRSSH